jgi:hypothetical protein
MPVPLASSARMAASFLLSLAGKPCRPSDGPSAQRAGRVKAAAAHRAVARSASLCVGHVRQFGGESPLCNLMEVKH